VRFNAEKKKVGNYFSTPIFSFRMKHVTCGGWIEIRTDPKNTAYVVTEGGRKRDLGEDKVEEGDVKILTQEEREALRVNAFAALEGKVEDKKRLEHSKKRLEELQDLSEQQWEDPYEKNKKLRSLFREGRKLREREAGVAAALQDKMSLGVDLLPEHADDVKRVGFIEFGGFDSEKIVDRAVSKPLFEMEHSTGKEKSKSSKHPKKRKAEDDAKQKAADLAAEIRGNTRAVLDPFLTDRRSSCPGATKMFPKSKLVGVKKKRPKLEEAPAHASGITLVNYDSD
jgi:coiled-coil domain-containing protein 130